MNVEVLRVTGADVVFCREWSEQCTARHRAVQAVLDGAAAQEYQIFFSETDAGSGIVYVAAPATPENPFPVFDELGYIDRPDWLRLAKDCESADFNQRLESGNER